MHKDIRKLNKEDPPPKGYRHPAYEVTPARGSRIGEFTVAYLNDGKWNMPVRSFPTERAAFSFILDQLYYGDD